jgi:hypothetical protein
MHVPLSHTQETMSSGGVNLTITPDVSDVKAHVRVCAAEEREHLR